MIVDGIHWIERQFFAFVLSNLNSSIREQVEF